MTVDSLFSHADPATASTPAGPAPDSTGGGPGPTATVVGVDLSYTGTGIAVWHDGLWTYATVRTPDDRPLEDRWSMIRRAVWARLTDHTLVVVEAPIPMKGKVPLELAMLQGAVRSGLHARKVPFAVVQNTHLKLFAAGHGRAAKQEMLDTARARLGQQLYDDNQADAAWLVAMGLHRYGHPLCHTTREQDDQVLKVAWPLWTLEVGRG